MKRPSRLRFTLSIFLSLVPLWGFQLSWANDNAFPLLPGLEGAVGFWKQIFTRFSTSEVVFHDPLDPATIYTVLSIPENDQARAAIDKERARIMAEYDLREEDGRVRGQRGAKEQFLSGFKLAGRYLPQMQKIFREEGVPVELTYLPMVESAFNIRARSSAGAVGMWQFMPDTGKKFLRVTDGVDERKDPLASTRAAARLLKENRQILGNWPLAITAYNHGTEGIFRGINAVGSRNLVDLIRGYQSPTFGYASKNFYVEFLAVLDIINRKDIHFPGLRAHPPLQLQELELKKSVAIQSLFKPAGITATQFFEWNPAVSDAVKTLPSGYRVKLPPANIDRFVTAQRRLERVADVRKPLAATRGRDANRWSYHRVSAGENLFRIASRYRVSVDVLRQANGLSGTQGLIAGQRLKIPRG